MIINPTIYNGCKGCKCSKSIMKYHYVSCLQSVSVAIFNDISKNLRYQGDQDTLSP